jgi:hypothetical protein
MVHRLYPNLTSKRNIRDIPPGWPAFDILLALLGAWLVFGLYLDGYFHITSPGVETFFTPWHAVLYSGFLSCAAVLIGVALLNHKRGYPWAKSVPVGYELSLAGVPVFALGGVGDMVWHTIFGIEVSMDAVLSPPHLLIAFGASLVLTGPARSAWRCADKELRWPEAFPMLLSITLLLLVLYFFTSYANPFAALWAAQGSDSGLPPASSGSGVPVSPREIAAASGRQVREMMSAVSTILQTIILMGVLLSLVVRWRRLPMGSITFILVLSTTALTFMYSAKLSSTVLPLIVAALLTGVVGDILLRMLHPTPENAGGLRLFAFLVPVVLYALYFASVALTSGGIQFTPHFWMGNIVIAGVVGYLLSLLIVAPRSR